MDRAKHMTKTGKKIEFLLHPADHDSKAKKSAGAKWYIEKDEGDGTKGRYFCGVASGISVDAHGERMSAACVKDFHAQTQEKEILLYANHDRVYTQDIARLTKSEILDNGDWYTEYKLHNDSPEADIAWQQATGTGRYTKAKQFGFSIEGYIPDGAVDMSDGGHVIQKVDLDPGVALVSKPAYQTSVAGAIAKAFGSRPVKKDAMTTQIAQARTGERDFTERKWNLLTAYEQACEAILNSDKETDEKEFLIEQEQAALMEGLSALYTDIGYHLPDAQDILGGYKPDAKVSTVTDGGSNANKTQGKSNMAKTSKNDTDTVLANIEAQLEQLIDLEHQEQHPDGAQEELEEHKAEDEEVHEAAKAASRAVRRARILARKLKSDDMTDEEKKELEEEEEELKAEEEHAMAKSRRRKAAPVTDEPPPKEGAGNARTPAEQALLVDVNDPDQATAKTLRILSSLAKTQIGKSAQMNQTAKSIDSLVRVVKGLVAKQSELEAAMVNMMNGMGITDQIAQVTRKSESRAMNSGFDSAAFDALVNMKVEKALASAGGRTQASVTHKSETETIRGNGSVLRGIFSGGR
jgi:hypothetical protein